MGANAMPTHIANWWNHGNKDFQWRRKFFWWPKRSDQSNHWIWLTTAWYGHRLVFGPAGEGAVKLELCYTEKEYLIYLLKGKS